MLNNLYGSFFLQNFHFKQLNIAKYKAFCLRQKYVPKESK